MRGFLEEKRIGDLDGHTHTAAQIMMDGTQSL